MFFKKKQEDNQTHELELVFYADVQPIHFHSVVSQTPILKDKIFDNADGMIKYLVEMSKEDKWLKLSCNRCLEWSAVRYFQVLK